MAVDESTATRTAQLQAERERYVAKGLATTPLFVDHAHGARLTDVDGREYLDFVGGIGALNGGHTPERVVNAIREQAGRFLHTSYNIAGYAEYVEVAKRLIACHPGSFEKKALLVNSGAEAVENAVKFARYATGRDGIVCFDQAFHGRTLLAMTLTSKANPYKKGMGPFAPEIYRASGPYPYRGVSGADALASVRKLFKSQVDPSNVAAIIYEPVQGEGGFLPAPDGFVAGLIEICREHGVLYIDDEVQAGMCRTGTPAAVERWGVEPDLCVWGKSMSGGMPLAGVTGRSEIMDSIHVGGVGGTYAGNPLCCVAAIEALDEVLDPDYQRRSAELGDRMRASLEGMMAANERIGEVRGLGAMLALELVEDRATKTPDAALTSRTVELARERGLILMASGIYSNVIRILVPLVATDEDIREGLSILESSLRDAAA